MTDEERKIEMPREGMSTLVTQYTADLLEKWAAAIRTLREKGKTEGAILKEMRDNHVGSGDPHTLSKIYRRALGAPIPDDFIEENITRVEPVKENTIRLTAQEPVPHLEYMSLVYWKGEAWFVQTIDGSSYLLKKVV